MGKRTYVELLSPRELPAGDLDAAGDAEIEGLELRASTVAGLRLAVGADAGFEVAHLARTVVAVSTQNIRGGVAHVGLREAGHKTIGGLAVPLDGLLEEVGGQTLVVARDVRVVAEHRGGVNGEPGQNANVLAVRRSLEPQQGQGLVHIVGVLRSLRLGVGKV